MTGATRYDIHSKRQPSTNLDLEQDHVEGRRIDVEGVCWNELVDSRLLCLR